MDISSHIVNKEIVTKTTDSECTNNTTVCSCKKVIKLMKEFTGTNNSDDSAIVEDIKQKLNCGDSESCVLNNPDFVKFVEKKDSDLVKHTLINNFKTKGPRDSTKLLSNFNIDDTLFRWSREFRDFFPCSFSMIDFYKVSSEFGTIDISKVFSGKESYRDPLDGSLHGGPFRTFACVINTDVSYGRGKHWVCMFADHRGEKCTIEYFNSSGNPPNEDVTKWMEKQRSNMLKICDKVDTITVTNIVHQKSNTECGMYVLYYIRSRLDGIPFIYFLTKRIDDSIVTEFRKHVFRKN